jgi:hypothetical protein
MGGQRHASAVLPAGKRTDTNCTGGQVGPRAGLERVRKICSPPGFDSLTSQPLASYYTEYAIPALEETTTTNKITSSILFSKWCFTS